MQILSLNEAKKRLDKLADAALRGKPVLIIRKTKLLILQCYEMPEPLLLRPRGYFNDLYTKEEVAEVNLLASRAPIGTKP